MIITNKVEGYQRSVLYVFEHRHENKNYCQASWNVFKLLIGTNNEGFVQSESLKGFLKIEICMIQS